MTSRERPCDKHRCSVIDCLSTRREKYHHFPKNKNLGAKWVKATGNPDLLDLYTTWPRSCIRPRSMGRSRQRLVTRSQHPIIKQPTWSAPNHQPINLMCWYRGWYTLIYSNTHLIILQCFVLFVIKLLSSTQII